MSVFYPAAANVNAIGHNQLCDARCCLAQHAAQCNATHFVDGTGKTFFSRRADTLRSMERRAMTLAGAHASRCTQPTASQLLQSSDRRRCQP